MDIHKMRRKEEDNFQMIKYLHRHILLIKLLLSLSVGFIFINTAISVFAADTTQNIPGVCAEFNPNGTPTIGKVRMPVFLVDFSDEHFSENALSADEIAHILFSNETGSMTTFIKMHLIISCCLVERFSFIQLSIQVLSTNLMLMDLKSSQKKY